MNVDVIKIPSTKGNIAIAVHRPEDVSSKLAILCPGNLDSKDYLHLVRLADDLCAQGFTAVRIDPTGTWESEGTDADYLTTQYLSDVQNVLNHMLAEHPYTTVVMLGHSRGAKISLLTAARDPRITAVVAIMPPSGNINTGITPEEWKQLGVRVSTRNLPYDKTKTRTYTIPYSHHEDNMQYVLLNEVKRVHVPTLYITGENDKIVAPEDVRRLYETAHEPKTFVSLPDIGHDYRHYPDEVAVVNDSVLQFIM